jgi:PAS domain S-box-containing protein
MGWAYFNLIHPDDIERIRHLWEDCRREDRQFRATFKMVSSDGEAILFNAVATPIPEHGVTRRWIGVIRKVVQQ